MAARCELFVSEYLCSGACCGAELSVSLLNEGRAMLLAVLEDIALWSMEETKISGEEFVITTTWDQRLGPFPLSHFSMIRPHIVQTTEAEQQLFDRLAERAAAALVIAPEFAGLLTARRRRLNDLMCSCRESAEGERSPLSTLRLDRSIWNCDEPAIELFGDKWRTAVFCQTKGIPTIPTSLLNHQPSSWWPAEISTFVLKPRYGAGSSSIRSFQSIEECQRATKDEDGTNWIVQPRIEGRAVSFAAIYGDSAQLQMVLPWVEQRLSVDGCFRYLGGRLPIAHIGHEGWQKVVAQSFNNCGLRGYVGFDVILPSDDVPPLLVEVNPRLTTSYIGYRAAASPLNLAPLLMGKAVSWPETLNDVTFDADGTTAT